MLFGEMIGFLASDRPDLLGPAAHGRRQWAQDSSSDPSVQRPARGNGERPPEQIDLC